MRALKTIVVAVLLFGTTAAATAGSVNQAGNRVAQRMGYSGPQADCFSKVFVRYASLNRQGRWTVVKTESRRGSPGVAFRNDLLSECGIQR